ncbi:hypothetical protein [Paenibacillus motobuensis]
MVIGLYAASQGEISNVPAFFDWFEYKVNAAPV